LPLEITELWNELLLRPMLNGLIVLYSILFQNFGLSIIVFTILVRLVMLPLTLKQLHASKAMSTLQPKLQELQRRYGKDKQKLSQETMKLYREQGINPAGCLFPMLIQMPIWIGLYQSIIQALAAAPDALLDLSQHLYPGLSVVRQVIPLGSQFFWLDLSKPDPFSILPILVGGSMWVQQKMMTMPTTDPKQATTNQMMLWTMPIMFGFFTLQFPSGLAIYWVVSNIISIVLQYFVTGWGTLMKTSPKVEPASKAVSRQASAKAQAKRPVPAAVAAGNPTPKIGKRTANGKPRGKRKNSGGSNSPRPEPVEDQPLRSGDNGTE